MPSPAPLTEKQILLVLKRSKWERDLQRYGSAATVRKIYQRQNQSLERVFESHKRQTANIALLRKELPDAHFLYQEELPFIHQKEFELLVSVGGDNHFVHVCHFADGRPVLGVNSDPKTSTGALLAMHPKQAARSLRRLLNEPDWQSKLAYSDWSRFEARISYPDGKEIRTEACISEMSVRSQFHDYISRYLIRLVKEGRPNADFEEHKCSGLLLATGAGSTGWYRNCLPPDWQDRAVFEKEAPFFRGVAREPGKQLRQTGKWLYPEIGKANALEIISEMDGEITVDADPNRIYPFPPGAVAVFRLAEQKLRVVAAPDRSTG